MGYFDNLGVKFTKNGKEVKSAISKRLSDLQKRLEKRNIELDEIMSDKTRLRSYLVRNKDDDYPHGGQIKHELPTEDHQRIGELCKRICLIEKEMKQLEISQDNIKDEQEFELMYDDLISLGFGPRDEIDFG
jgi:CII-binding regulator of phage lambda lysogenization HflD